MKKLVLLVLLVGCAQQPQEPTDAQLAVLAYYADVCKKKGVDTDDLLTLKGCIIVTYEQDIQSGKYSRQTNFSDVVQGLGSVYSAAGVRQTQCETRPDYLGGAVTTCR